MHPAFIETLGFAAALLSTLGWVPQAWRTIKTHDTRAISLWTQAILATAVALWLVYGLLIGSWPLIGANLVTLALVLTILVMKLRHG